MVRKNKWPFEDDPIIGAREKLYNIRTQRLSILRDYCTDLRSVPTLKLEHLKPLTHPGSILISFDFWNDLICDLALAPYIDFTRRDICADTGFLGTVFGFSLVTDGYFDTQDRVLEYGEVFLASGAIAYEIDDILSEMESVNRCRISRIVRKVDDEFGSSPESSTKNPTGF